MNRRVLDHKMRIPPFHPLEPGCNTTLIIFHGYALIPHATTNVTVVVVVITTIDAHIVFPTTGPVPPGNISFHRCLSLNLIPMRFHASGIVNGKPHISS